MMKRLMAAKKYDEGKGCFLDNWHNFWKRTKVVEIEKASAHADIKEEAC